MLEQFLTFEDVHIAATVFVPFDPVGKLQRRFTEEDVTALVLQCQKSALNRTDRLRCNVAIGQLEFLCVVADILHHTAQILHVDQQKILFIGNAEDDAQNSLLRVIESKQSGKQRRSHLGNSCADRKPLFAVNIPELHGIGAIAVAEFVKSHRINGAADVLVLRTGLAHTG